MKCVGILGSPRPKSNSAAVAEKFLDQAATMGAEVTIHRLSDMNYSGCIACGGCKTKSETCVVEDDLLQALEDLRNCDIAVLASPVYFSEVSGQFKSFFDRTYSFVTPQFTTRLEPGKKALMILSQGQPDPGKYRDVFDRYGFWLNFYGFGKAS